MKTQKGFATVLLMSTLPVILAGGLALFCAFGFLKADLATLNVCRAKQLAIQNKAAANLNKLLKLNPRALKLRLAQIRAERLLAAAIKSGSPPAIAAAETYLLKVQLQRQTLNIKQKNLIQTANTWLVFGGSDLQRDLVREWNLHGSPLKSWFQASIHLATAKIPKLAVQADLPEVAPVYGFKPQFEDAQSWEQAWDIEFKTVSWVQKVLHFKGRFHRSCLTSLYANTDQYTEKHTDQWSAKLKKGKSSLKGFF